MESTRSSFKSKIKVSIEPPTNTPISMGTLFNGTAFSAILMNRPKELYLVCEDGIVCLSNPDIPILSRWGKFVVREFHHLDLEIKATPHK